MTEKPIRILHCIAGMGSGGAEMFIMNVYRNIDREKVQFDFLLRSKDIIYEKEIMSYGGRIFYTDEYPKHYFKNRSQTKNFIKEHANEYMAIHVHGNALLYVNVLKFAKRYGIKKRIMHMHNTSTKRKIYTLLHLINRKRLPKLITHKFACSKAASRWGYKNDNNVIVINNAIDINKFKFDNDTRNLKREELNVKNNFVIGMVARFLPAKNHVFILDVLKDVCQKREDVKLLLIGSGQLEKEIQQKVVQLGLEDNVIFLGERKDVCQLMQAMDVLVLPSKYEGLGIVLIEGQVSGLTCLASDKVTEESKISNNIHYFSIENNKQWVDFLINESTNCEREFLDERAFTYDVKNTVGFLENFYCGNVDE